MVFPSVGANTDAQRLRLSCHKCITSGEDVIEVVWEAYQVVREGP